MMHFIAAHLTESHGTVQEQSAFKTFTLPSYFLYWKPQYSCLDHTVVIYSYKLLVPNKMNQALNPIWASLYPDNSTNTPDTCYKEKA